jgi:hypothetical protein
LDRWLGRWEIKISSLSFTLICHVGHLKIEQKKLKERKDEEEEAVDENREPVKS